jgi:dUTP pyrophosphatase
LNGEGLPESTGSTGPIQEIGVGIVRLQEHADLPLPCYQTPGSAGADLCAAVREPLVVRFGETCLVPTGIRLAIPAGYEAQVRPRSGLALRTGLTLANAPGTIDSDYRGEIKVVMTCLKHEPCTIRRGDRVAQIVFAPVVRATFVPEAELTVTDRGAGGFGHPGVGRKAGGGGPAG